MTSRYLLLALVIGASACKGSIEGAVYGTDDEQPVRVTGHPVYLLPASSETASALKASCPAVSAAAWKATAESERRRLTDATAAYADSARNEFARNRGTPEWKRLRFAMMVYRDSAAGVDDRPPNVPPDLIEKLATKQADSGPDGRYSFPDLEPGQYLIAVELRDEYRWVPVRVARAKATANVSPRTSKSGCDVAQGL